jgi:lipopolysaccharide export system protein LptA
MTNDVATGTVSGRNLTVLVLMIAALCLGALAAEDEPAVQSREAADSANASDESTETSNWIVGRCDEWFDDPDAGKRVLIGKVIMDREDGSGYLWGDRVTMYSDPHGDSRAIERTVAEGSVNLKEGDVVATSDRAVFTDGNNFIHLTGSVVVLMDRDRMECEEFTLDRRTGERHGSGGVQFRVRLSQDTAQEPFPDADDSEPDAATDAEPSHDAD